MDNVMSVKERFKKLYPQEAQAFENAQSDEELTALKNQFLLDAKQRLIQEIEKTDLKNTVDLEALKGTDETVAVAITESVYKTLINARGDQIETELIKFFDTVERLKDMGTQDAEVLTYAMVNGGIAALGIAMVTDLILNLLQGLGLAEAIFTAVVSLGTTVVGAIVDIIVLCIIPIFYFMAKPAACIFMIINELETNLVIDEEKVVHGKVNVKTREIAASLKIIHTTRSGGIWSTQKKDAALIGTQYGVVLRQAKGISGVEPDNTKFAVGVECPLASGNNSCAVGINKTASQIADEVDDHRRQSVSVSDGKYGIEMHCNSGSGSLAYYICRIYKC